MTRWGTSHLGERLAAVVDDELAGVERERALAHLAGCAACRDEVEAHRALQRRLRALRVDVVRAAPAQSASNGCHVVHRGTPAVGPDVVPSPALLDRLAMIAVAPPAWRVERVDERILARPSGEARLHRLGSRPDRAAGARPAAGPSGTRPVGRRRRRSATVAGLASVVVLGLAGVAVVGSASTPPHAPAPAIAVPPAGGQVPPSTEFLLKDLPSAQLVVLPVPTIAR